MRMQSQPALIYLHYWAMLKMDGYTDTVEDSIDIVLKVQAFSWQCSGSNRSES